MYPTTLKVQVSCCEDCVLVPSDALLNLTDEVINQIKAAREHVAQMKAEGVSVSHVRLADLGIVEWLDEDGSVTQSNEEGDSYRVDGIDVHENHFQVFGYLNFHGAQFQCESVFESNFDSLKAA